MVVDPFISKVLDILESHLPASERLTLVLLITHDGVVHVGVSAEFFRSATNATVRALAEDLEMQLLQAMPIGQG